MGSKEIQGMSESETSSRKAVDRISRLKKRCRNLQIHNPSPTQLGEISALEWAIPILEQYCSNNFIHVPKERIFSEDIAIRKKIVQALLSRYGADCYLCERFMRKGDRSIDHVIPLSKGGKDEMSNYRLAHSLCNAKKGNKLLIESKEV